MNIVHYKRHIIALTFSHLTAARVHIDVYDEDRFNKESETQINEAKIKYAFDVCDTKIVNVTKNVNEIMASAKKEIDQIETDRAAEEALKRIENDRIDEITIAFCNHNNVAE